MILHIFNPSHDEALAVNKTQYCPSLAARRTGATYWDVARWWAASDDVILHLPEDGSLRGVEVPDWDQVDAIEPWGWDRHITGLLRRLGAPDRLLPTEADLDRIRHLSSRETAVRVVALLPTDLQGIIAAQNRWCTTEEEIRQAVTDYGGSAMLKQPWSCSGRGVWHSLSEDLEVTRNGLEKPKPALQRMRKTLREQGAVEVEPLYTSLGDFAMEFWAETDGTVRYEGLSLFSTHEGGGYAGNVVASDAILRQRLSTLAGTALPLDALADTFCRVLATVLDGGYHGPLGVDMMLTPDGIHPCIEVNLRNTMGRVALLQCRHQQQTDSQLKAND